MSHPTFQAPGSLRQFSAIRPVIFLDQISMRIEKISYKSHSYHFDSAIHSRSDLSLLSWSPLLALVIRYILEIIVD
jgi:hypothetical protein